MCLYPRLIRNPKYRANTKNGGLIPPIYDHRVVWVPIGCQDCIECRKQKAREWQLRMLEDIKEHKNGKFITLTFSNESIEKLAGQVVAKTDWHRQNKIACQAVRYFLERWRKKYKKSLRHWLITELGHKGTERIHLHGIVWTDESLQEVEDKWQYGHVWKGKEHRGKLINYVNAKTVNYIIKYVTKQDWDHRGYKSEILSSPGIGKRYTTIWDAKRNEYKSNGTTKEYYTTDQGAKIAMPRYWRNKIYTEEQKEWLWIEKLNREERYVCGEKVSIKGGDKNYYKMLEWHRERTQKLGYQNPEIKWNRIQYEKTRKEINTPLTGMAKVAMLPTPAVEGRRT